MIMDLLRIAIAIAAGKPKFLSMLPESLYHSGDALNHDGGLNGILPGGHQDNMSDSWSDGPFPNVVNLAFTRGESLDYTPWESGALRKPGIIYEVKTSKLDWKKFRPNDQYSTDIDKDPSDWTDEEISEQIDTGMGNPMWNARPYIAYADIIKDAIISIEFELPIDDEVQYVKVIPFSSEHRSVWTEIKKQEWDDWCGE
jgi:hypothetical protein